MRKRSTVLAVIVTLVVAVTGSTASWAGGFKALDKNSAVMLNPQPLPPGPPPCKCDRVSSFNKSLNHQGFARGFTRRSITP